MTGTKVVLTLNAESAEGIHEIIESLEEIIDDMKGGYESKTFGIYCTSGCGCVPGDGPGDHPGAQCIFKSEKRNYEWSLNTEN